MSLNGIVIAAAALLSVVFVYFAITERDLLKAAAFSAGQSVAYSLLFQVFASPDVLLAYIAVSVGIYSALIVYVISKTERYEAEGR